MKTSEFDQINQHIDVVVMHLRAMYRQGPDPLGRGGEDWRIYWIRRHAKEKMVQRLQAKRAFLQSQVL